MRNLSRPFADRTARLLRHRAKAVLAACLWLLALAALAGCSGGAVVFAPTPAPPDTSPLRYTHPSGAFSVSVPRQWARYEENTTTLASVSFAPPDSDTPQVLIAAVKLTDQDAAADFGSLIDLYQTQVRPDTGSYAEVSREAMGDGSWRLTGLRHATGGIVQQINTFIQRAGSVIGVIDVLLPPERLTPAITDHAAGLDSLQNLVNTFSLNPDADLEPAPLATLTFAKEADLAIIHVAAWNTPSGVFYITGEIANYGTSTISDLPIEASLGAPDGVQVGGAVDTVMGYGIPPGGFAPFSLRFGGGQGTLASVYSLRLGKDWTPTPDAAVIGEGALVWTDEANFDSFNRLVISGRVTNTGSTAVRQPRAIATVFDGAQNVIGAAWTDLQAEQIVPGASVPFEIVIGEYGGDPENYIILVQGLP